jgi:hypothetical protein
VKINDLAVPFVEEVKCFIDDFNLFEDRNPIQQKLDPRCKTTRVGVNCRSLVDFLSRQGIFSEEEVAQSLRVCAFMSQDMNRCKRAEWVLNQYEIYFEPRLGAHPHSVALNEDEVDCVWQIVAIKENFVIVDKSDLADERYSSTEPIKIQLPPLAIRLLKVSDDLHVGIRKVTDADFYLITSVMRVEPSDASLGSQIIAESTTTAKMESLTVQESFAPIQTHDESRSDPAYKSRLEDLLERTPLTEPFPEELYTEQWFTTRELDFADDEEIITGTDMFDDDEYEDGDYVEDEDDSDEEG